MKKTMKSLKTGTDVRLISNKRSYLKWASKIKYMPLNTFEKD